MCRARRGGPTTLSRTADANLDCAFVENALLFAALKIRRAWPPLSAPPWTLHTFGGGFAWNETVF